MRYSIVLLSICFLLSCDDNSVIPPGNVNISSGDVLVVNEGGFQKGNASVGMYSEATNTYTANVYQNVNGSVIGDVLQQVVSLKGEYWVVVNNSGKIEVVDSTDLKTKHVITGLSSPRHIVFNKSNTKAYVSDLYADEVAVINTSTYKIEYYIPIEGWTDQMVITDSLLYIANRERPFVFVVDPTSYAVIDSIGIGHNPNSLLRLQNGYLAVICEGRLGSSDIAKFQIIHPETRKVIKEENFSSGEKPSLLRQSPINGNIYCAFKGVYYIHPVDYTNQGKVIDLPEANIYGFDIDPVTGNFYVSDAKDYVKKSEVRVYKNGSDLKQQFTAGVICNGFVFR